MPASRWHGKGVRVSLSRLLLSLLAARSFAGSASGVCSNNLLNGSCEAGPSLERLLWGHRVVSHGSVGPALLHIREGRFEKVLLRASHKEAIAYAKASDLELEVVTDAVISPGLIDTHVHLSPLNRTWEGYTTGSEAAAAGGVTTLVLMPLNSLPPTTTVEALEMEFEVAAASKLHADIGFWGGVVPGNLAGLRPLLAAGVLGIKAFLSPLPPSAGFEAVTPSELREAAPDIAAAGVPLLVHAELMTKQEADALVEREGGSTRSFTSFLRARPREFEQRAHKALVKILDEVPGLHVHIVHLSDATSLGFLANQRERLGRARLTIETCPHYLILSAEGIPEGDTRFKCLPPIREGWNRALLLEGLVNGTIDTVGSDHSPCELSMRQLESGDFFKAWAGLTALQYSLPATWTVLRQSDQMPHENGKLLALAKWWSEEPAALAGLNSSKGHISEGFDADLVIWEPDVFVTQEQAFHRHGGSPYAGQLLRGAVLETVLRGHTVFRHGRPAAAPGRLLLAERRSP